MGLYPFNNGLKFGTIFQLYFVANYNSVVDNKIVGFNWASRKILQIVGLAILSLLFIPEIYSQSGSGDPCHASNFNFSGKKGDCLCDSAVDPFPTCNKVPCGSSANTLSNFKHQDWDVTWNTGDFEFANARGYSCSVDDPSDGQQIAWYSFLVQAGGDTFEWQITETGGDDMVYQIFVSYNTDCPDCPSSDPLNEDLTYWRCGDDFTSWEVLGTPDPSVETRFFVAVYEDERTGHSGCTGQCSYNLKFRRACGEGCSGADQEWTIDVPDTYCSVASCPGASLIPLDITVNDPPGPPISYTYNWFPNNDDSPISALSDPTVQDPDFDPCDSNLPTTGFPVTLQYRVVIQGVDGGSNPDIVCPQLAFVTIIYYGSGSNCCTTPLTADFTSNSVVCTSDALIFDATVTNAQTPIDLTYTLRDVDGNIVDQVSNSTSTTYQYTIDPVALSDAGLYNLEVDDNTAGCFTFNSLFVIVEQTPSAPSTTSATVCEGESGDLIADCLPCDPILFCEEVVGTMTYNETSGTYGTVDFTGVTFPTGSTITKVEIAVEFEPIDGTDCVEPGTGAVDADGVSFSVEGPGAFGSQVLVKDQDATGGATYTDNSNSGNGTVTVIFDQTAASVPSGTPTSGSFDPDGGDVSLWDGDDPTNYSWTLTAGDLANNGGDNVLCVHSFQVCLTLEVPSTTNWYDTEVSTTIVHTGSTFSTSTAGTYWAECTCGNCSSPRTSATLTVEDCCVDPPTITCPADWNACPGTPTDVGTTGSATALPSAYCDAPSITSSDMVISTGPCAGATVIERTWTATDPDDSSKSASCVQTITLEDTTVPIITCPVNVTIQCDDSTASADNGEASATDNCSIPADITIDFSDSPSLDGCNGTGSITRTWVAEDACGNTSSCDQILTVVDTEAPVITCPVNVTIQCDDSIASADNGEATATDNCAIPADITIDFSDSPSLDGCNGTGSITRTWVAEDACGNTSSCDQILTVIDTEAPVITCPVNVTIQCDDSTASVDNGEATATDNCAIPADITIDFSDSPSLGGCNSTGTITRTWIAEDACGNTSSCDQILTVIDTEAPVITCPANVTIQCDDSTASADNGEASATDNCTIPADITIDFTDSPSLGGCNGAGTITRTWVAEDVCGNTSSCDQILTVVDTEAPVITCPANVTIQCDDSTASADNGEATATDNCAIPADITIDFSDSPSLDGCNGTGSITRTWVAEDACGNTSSCDQILTVIDTEAPVITCPVNVTIQCDDSTASADNGEATATDNCAIPADITIDFSDSPSLDGCNGTGSITRTWVAEDACGNTSSCDQILTVIDTEAPVITCPVNVTIQCDDSTASADNGEATATDNCAIPADITMDFSDSPSLGGCNGTGTITRTWVAEDACGNTSSCDQILTVIDTEAPVITCPANVTIQCDDSTASADNGEATATDNCTIPADITINFSDNASLDGCNGTGTITRTWVAEDACGNTSSCDQILTVIDTETPVITCPANVTIQCDDSTASSDNGEATATDNCTIPVDITIDFSDSPSLDGCNGTGTITRTWVAEDACGNTSSCDQILTVIDTESPVITCPANVTIQCDDSTASADNGEATATDNCAIPADITIDFSDTPSLDGCNGTGTITRTWVAEDACGNTSSCDQILTVIDTEAPVITCPANVTIQCDDPTASADNGEATATDNCAIPADITIDFSDSPSLDGCNGTGSIIRTWVAEDACGNTSSCDQILTVIDTEAPVITCPVNVTIQCDDSTASADNGEATATDNCAIPADITMDFTDSPSLGGCNGTGSITRTWVAEDACGNTSSCDQILTVIDTEAPVITCPVNVTIQCDDSTAAADNGEASATDNCTIPADITIDFTDGPSLGGCNGTGSITRTWVAEDACGNTSSCDQILTVIDTEAPVITCPANVTIQCDDSTASADNGEASATDNCAIPADITIDFSDSPSLDGCNGTGIITRTWVAEDACGNTSSCDQILTVIDTEAPVITCPANVTIQCDDPTASADNGEATATDNCAIPTDITIDFSDSPSLDGCNGTGSITRTWVAEDACGNTSSCDQILTVIDTEAPVITCPANVTIQCDDSTASADNGEATATDNCTIPADITINFSDNASLDGCNGTGTITRTWVAEDACGNTSSCDQILTVIDTEAPVITCPVNVTIQCDDSTAAADNGEATATDNCTIPVDITIDFSDSPSLDGCNGTGTITRTWVAEDACGNTSSCDQILTVIDTESPVITCPANVTIQCDDSTASADNGEATATDNCAIPADITIDFSDTPSLDGCNGTGTITRTWVAEDACGNTSSCDQILTVIDTEAPIITCPSNITVPCDGSTDPSFTGMPIASGDCDPSPVFTFIDDVTLSGCPEEGTIIRTWTATDACGNTSTSCQQMISVNMPQIGVAKELSSMIENGDGTYNVAYIITIVNTGELKLNNVKAKDDLTITFPLPTTFSKISGPTSVDFAVNAGYNGDSDTDLLDGSDMLDAGESGTIEIVFQIDPNGAYGPFDNTTSVEGVTINDTTVNDDSQDGTDVDPDMDGNPTNNNVPTPISFPSLGVAKQVTNIVDNGNDTYDVVYTILVENTGQLVLNNLQVVDDLNLAFPLPATYSVVSGPTSSEFSVNGSYNGDGDKELLAGTDILSVGSSGWIEFTVRLTPNKYFGPFENIAVGEGTTGDGIKVSDDSEDGTDVDPDMDGDPTNNDKKTPLEIPALGVAKIISSGPTYLGNAKHNLVYSIKVENVGSTTLNNLQVTDDLSTALSGITGYTINNVSITQQPSSSILIANWPGYDGGTTDDELLDGLIGLETSEFFIVEIDLDVTILPGDPTGPFDNTAIASGSSPTNLFVEDESDVGINSTDNPLTGGDNSGHPDNQGTTDDPTPFEVCNLAVLCPNTNGGTVQCVENVTAPIPGDITVNESCSGAPLISIATTDDGGDGCVASPLIVTHTYTVDDDGDLGTTLDQVICIVNVTVVDDTDPIISCPADVTIECNASTDPVDIGSATATDNCSEDVDIVLTSSDAISLGTCPQQRIITRTWRATDECGNSGTCSQSITLIDTTDPIISCPVDVTIECNASTNPANTGNATATDNCSADGVISISSSDETSIGTCPQQRIITRTWTATDECNNSSTCSQTIVLTDTQKPLISCPVDVTIDCDEITDPANTGTATATDNCSAPGDITINSSDVTTGGVCVVGLVVTRRWTATDECGNSSSCIQSITWIDDKGPTIICPIDIVVVGTSIADAPAPDILLVTANDNCSTTTVVEHVSDVDNGGTGCSDDPFKVFRTYKATDECGNMSFCTQTIDIVLPVAYFPPVITCPRDTIISCDSPLAANLDPPFLPDGYNWPTTNDVCDNLDTTWVDVQDPFWTTGFDCFQINRTWTVTNTDTQESASCVQRIRVIDNEAPYFVDENDLPIPMSEWNPIRVDTVQDGDFTPTFTPLASDNCDEFLKMALVDEISTQDFGFSCSKYEYTLLRIFEARDNCGNTSTAVYEIQFIDTIAPRFISIFPGYGILKIGDNPEGLPIRDIDTYRLQDTINIYPGSGNCDPDLVLNPVIFDSNELGDMEIEYDLYVYDPVLMSYTYVSTSAYSGGPLLLLNLGQGSLYKVILKAEDACGNFSTLEALIKTRISGPLALCDEVVVALDDDGYVHLPSILWDQGSFDECHCPIDDCELIMDGTPEYGQLLVEVSRDGEPFHGFMSFSCLDVGQEIEVAFRVTNAAGGYNICYTRVVVLKGSSGFPVTGNVTDASNPFTPDGSITAFPLSSYDNFTFEWSNQFAESGVKTSTISGLLPGQYQVTVTEESYGCQEEASFTVGANDEDGIVVTGGSTGGGPGTLVSVPFTVENFDNVGGFTLTANMANQPIGDFVGINYVNPAVGTGISFPPVLGPGIKSFTLVFIDISGLTLAKDEVLFTVDIRLSDDVALLGMSSDISLTGVSFINATTISSIPYTTYPGDVTIIAGMPELSLSGNITTAGPNMAGVANVQVDNSLGGNEMTNSPTGAYSFSIDNGNTATIDPYQILDSDNAWETGWDLGDPFLIKAYLVNQWPSVLGPGPSPCQFIAMDVNFSGGVDIGDALIIERILALLPTPFNPPQESWRFIAIDDCSSLPVNPLMSGFAESYTLGPVVSSMNDINFKAVKVGDVNFTFDGITTVSNITGGDPGSQVRNEETLQVLSTKSSLIKDEVFNIAVRIEKRNVIGGLQFTLDYDPDMIEIVDLSSSVLENFTFTSFHQDLHNGSIPVVWTNGKSNTVEGNEVIFNIKVKALSDVEELSKAIEINSSIAQAMALLTEGGLNLLPLEWIFEEKAKPLQKFKLYPNKPNPFAEETVIGFDLPQSEKCIINIYSFDGSVIKTIVKDFSAGYNEITINEKDLRSGNLFFYQLSTRDHSETRKMFVIR